MTDEPHVEHRRVDARRRYVCRGCGNMVPAPETDPLLRHGNQLHQPMLVSFRCPICDRVVYTNPADEPENA